MTLSLGKLDEKENFLSLVSYNSKDRNIEIIIVLNKLIKVLKRVFEQKIQDRKSAL